MAVQREIRTGDIQIQRDRGSAESLKISGVRRHQFSFDIAANGKVGPKREFAKLDGFRQTDAGPTSGADGLAVDADVSDPATMGWLRANGYKYGFVEAVPREPWHWEYADVPIARGVARSVKGKATKRAKSAGHAGKRRVASSRH